MTREVEGTKPGEVTERASGTGPEPEVMIEPVRGPDGPAIVAALERILARIRAELGDDQVAA